MKLGPRSFVGGEVSDRLYGRPDDPRYNHGAEILQNAVVTATGVAQKRPGTAFVRESRNSAEFKLLTYRISAAGDVWIEFGLRTEYPSSSDIETYMRFHREGGTILHSTPWDAEASYAVGAHVTSGGVLYRCVLAHTNQVPPNATYWLSLAYSAASDYAVGDLVSHGGGVYYCSKAHTSAGPVTPGTETHWYLMPATGEYEIPTQFRHTTRAHLAFSLTSSQEGDTMTIASPLGRPHELRLVGTTWTCQEVFFKPTLSPPTGVAAAATKRGNTYVIWQLGPDAGLLFVTFGTLVPLVADLDIVYIEGTPVAAINDKYWRVMRFTNSVWNTTVVRLADPETGVPYAYAGGTFGGLNTPSGTARATNLNSAETNTYVVTAVDSTGRESQASASATVTNNLNVSGSLNTITWSTVTGAARYNVYKQAEGTSLYGFIGQTEGTSFEDTAPGIAPSLDRPPPIIDTSLDNKAPRAVTNFEGRRWFGGPGDAQQDVWGTKTNTSADLSYSIPLRATDRIQQRIKSRLGCTIRHLVPLGELIVLTDTTEFRITSPEQDALTPDSFVARAQSYVGASGVQPEVLGSLLLFAAARGGHLYQFGFVADGAGYLSSSICERSTHLFDGFVSWQLTAQRAPMPLLWSVRSDGLLLGCTFIPAQQVLAWHRHTTDGIFETAAAGWDNGTETTYVGTVRTINGNTKRFVERMATMDPVAWADSWFVDCGLRYQGAPTATVTGLDHLEGKTVQVFADGLVQTPKVVIGGAITLDAVASSVTVGLGYRMLAKSVPATFAVEAFGSSRPKNVGKVWVRATASGAWRVGIDESQLDPAPSVPGVPFTGQVEVRVPAKWTEDGQLLIVSDDPTPLNVVSYTADAEVAG